MMHAAVGSLRAGAGAALLNDAGVPARTGSAPVAFSLEDEVLARSGIGVWR